MKNKTSLSLILAIFFFPIYGSCQENIVIFIDELAIQHEGLSDEEKIIRREFISRLIKLSNNCGNLKTLSLEATNQIKEVKEDLQIYWREKYNSTRMDSVFIPSEANVIVRGKVTSDHLEHNIEVEVYDLRNSRSVNQWIVRDKNNFFRDDKKLQLKIDTLFNRVFNQTFFEELNINCLSQERKKYPGAPKLAFYVGGSALSLGLIYMGIQRMRAFKSLDDCLSFLPNKGGCTLYHDVYLTKTNPEDPIYPYSFKEDGLSRDEVYKAANTRFKIDQILFYGFGTLGLLYTWKDFIPGWKKANFWHPFAASNLKLSTDPIPQIGFDTYGIGHWGGWGISVNKKF